MNQQDHSGPYVAIWHGRKVWVEPAIPPDMKVPDGCVEIDLTRGLFAVIDAVDFPLVSRYSWSASPRRDAWYAIATIGGREVEMGRLILGLPLTGREVMADHKAGHSSTLDNRRENIRPATHTQNCWNARKRPRRSSKGPASEFKGVCWNSTTGKWLAQIRVGGGVRKHLGLFSDEHVAARAYDSAARQFHGEFARLNFPE